jgi:hypothetical protein
LNNHIKARQQLLFEAYCFGKDILESRSCFRDREDRWVGTTLAVVKRAHWLCGLVTENVEDV